MANKTILMTKVMQILGYHHQHTSLKEICRLTGISRNTIKRYIRQFTIEELNWDDIERMTDYELDMLFANLTDIQPSCHFFCKTFTRLLAAFTIRQSSYHNFAVNQYILYEENS